MKSFEFIPPEEIITFHKSFSDKKEDNIPCFARLKLNNVIDWQIAEITSWYGKQINDSTKKLLDYAILCSWEQINYKNYNPRKELRYPDFHQNFIPILCFNIKRKTFGNIDKSLINKLLYLYLDEKKAA